MGLQAFPEDKRVVDAGFNLPTQLLAVVRTKRGLGTSKQASICTESMELRLTVTYSTFRDGEKRPLLYVTSKAGTVAGSKGVYVFNMREAGFGPTLEKEGTYVFTFSLVSFGCRVCMQSEGAFPFSERMCCLWVR